MGGRSARLPWWIKGCGPRLHAVPQKGVCLLVICYDRLIKLCDNYPDTGYRLMRNAAPELAFKIRGTDLAIREQLLWGPRLK